jgi:diguanylate cyclase (GGDEF)-like protein
MTIRQRIRLTGSIAVTSILLLLAWILIQHIQSWQSQRQAHAALASFDAWIKVVHQLQRERGTAAGFLTQAKTDPLRDLPPRMAETDAKIHQVPQRDSVLIQGLTLSLKPLRSEILAKTVSPLEAVDRYSRIIYELQIHLATSSVLPSKTQDFSVLIRLGLIKEHCGQIRAAIYRFLLQPNFTESPPTSGLQTQFLASHFIAGTTNTISPDVAHALSAGTLFPAIHDYFKHASTLMRSLPVRSRATANSWFSNASAFIDRLHATETSILSIITKATRDEINQSETGIVLISISTFIIACGIVILTISSFKKIIGSLNILRDSLAEAARTGNLALLENTAASPDEFARIHHEMQSLVESVRLILNEKETRASTDALTGLANRRSFNEALEIEVARLKRHPAPLSLIICDIDFFKRVNDTWGHLTGDMVLQIFAKTLFAKVRRSDRTARWGGEEFAVLAFDASLEDARQLAEKLRTSIAETSFGVVGKITASFGVAELQPDDNINSLVNRADTALYRSKADGRNRVTLG